MKKEREIIMDGDSGRDDWVDNIAGENSFDDDDEDEDDE